MSGGSPLPIGTIDPGTTLVIGSADLERAQALGTFLVSMGCGEEDGVLFTTTDTPGEKLLEQCASFDLDPETTAMQLIDGSVESDDGDESTESQGFGIGEESEGKQSAYDVGVERVPPADLTDLSIKFSVLYENLTSAGCQRVLAEVDTLSTILKQHDLRDSIRFLNTVSGRIENGNGLLVFVVDATAHDTETLRTLSQVCDGLVEIRAAGSEMNELRVHGLEQGPEEWVQVPTPRPRG